MEMLSLFLWLTPIVEYFLYYFTTVFLPFLITSPL